MSKWTKKWDSWTSPWWKTKKTEEKKKTRSASYWYDSWNSDFDYEGFYSELDSSQSVKVHAMTKTRDIYKLASVRRAISNFVNIVTGRNDIPVRYATRSNSYTDGKTVTLSSDINDHFDVGVGLALHEGSHIVLSDFDLLGAVTTVRWEFDALWRDIQSGKSSIDEFLAMVRRMPSGAKEKSLNRSCFTRYYDTDAPIPKWVVQTPIPDGCRMNEVLDTVGQLCNWIEDRRIDAYIYKTAPGYRDYYVQMYDYYFNSPEVGKGLESNEYRTEDIESYMFRIINMTNPKSDLTALRGLREIAALIDLSRIGRLKTTSDVYALSVAVFEVMLRYITDRPFRKKEDNPSGKSKGGESGEGGESETEITDVTDEQSGEQGGGGAINPKGMQGQMSATAGGDDNSSPTPSAKGTPKVALSKAALEKLRKQIEKQRKFLKDGVKKKSVTAEEDKKLNSIDESGTELVQVGTDYGDARTSVALDSKGNRISKGVSCVVSKRLTRATRDGDDDSFPFSITRRDTIRPDSEKTKSVAAGIQLGTLLGNRLAVRSESRDTVFNRLNKGKIDGRMISSLGYGNESVFYTKEIDQYKKVNLHISLDYSGSMQGTKQCNTIACAVAIVRACKIARNIDVQVSVRSTTRDSKPLPFIALVYDSRKDSFNEFADLMGRMRTGNTTPEGLCFEAIMRNFIPSNKEMDSYFLNISDGEPAFCTQDMNYQGEGAADHTARVVKRIREQGINVLSYFVTDRGDDTVVEHNRAWQLFKRCYGKDAKWINVQNLNEISRTLNELFLKKTPLHQQ